LLRIYSSELTKLKDAYCIALVQKGRKAMNDEARERSEHIQLFSMWAYHRKIIRLSSEKLQHLDHCESCSKLLGLCQISTSMAEVERWLTKSCEGGT
jgi:hypothetical protein